MKVHTFDSTGEAYDASQTHDEIHDGDVLSVPSEGVVGVLVEAWPLAVGAVRGEFHVLAVGTRWDAVPSMMPDGGTKDYSESLELAVETLDEIAMRASSNVHESDRLAAEARREEARQEYAELYGGPQPHEVLRPSDLRWD